MWNEDGGVPQYKGGGDAACGYRCCSSSLCGCEGLKLGTEYDMLVVAVNTHGENEIKMNSIRAMTSGMSVFVS